jgi:preprotein translocase subunit YajC
LAGDHLFDVRVFNVLWVGRGVLGLRFKIPGALLRPLIENYNHNVMDNLSLYALVDPVFAQAPSGGGLQSLLFPVLLIAAMWFLLIAPQRKKQKAQQEMIKALTTGDEVLTAGGIYGAITNIKDDRLVVRIAEGTKVEISRAFVQAVTKKASES